MADAPQRDWLALVAANPFWERYNREIMEGDNQAYLDKWSLKDETAIDFGDEPNKFTPTARDFTKKVEKAYRDGHPEVREAVDEWINEVHRRDPSELENLRKRGKMSQGQLHNMIYMLNQDLVRQALEDGQQLSGDAEQFSDFDTGGRPRPNFEKLRKALELP